MNHSQYKSYLDISLLLDFIEGKLSPEEAEKVKHHLTLNEIDQETVEGIQLMYAHENLSRKDLEEMVNDILELLPKETGKKARFIDFFIPQQGNPFFIYAAAACVVFLIGFFMWWANTTNVNTSSINHYAKKGNVTEKVISDKEVESDEFTGPFEDKNFTSLEVNKRKDSISSQANDIISKTKKAIPENVVKTDILVNKEEANDSSLKNKVITQLVNSTLPDSVQKLLLVIKADLEADSIAMKETNELEKQVESLKIVLPSLAPASEIDSSQKYFQYKRQYKELEILINNEQNKIALIYLKLLDLDKRIKKDKAIWIDDAAYLRKKLNTKIKD